MKIAFFPAAVIFVIGLLAAVLGSGAVVCECSRWASRR